MIGTSARVSREQNIIGSHQTCPGFGHCRCVTDPDCWCTGERDYHPMSNAICGRCKRYLTYLIERESERSGWIVGVKFLWRRLQLSSISGVV
jgi:hypothetical protein